MTWRRVNGGAGTPRLARWRGTTTSLLAPRTLLILPPLGRWFAALVFEPRDLWLGVYWTRDRSQLVLYVCLVPTVVWKLVRDGR